MNRKIIFKPASEKDFDEILNLEQKSFNIYDRLDRETLIELYSGFKDGFHTIIADDKVIGYSIFFIEDGSGYIESIAISDTYRHHGLGFITLKFMIKCIMDSGIDNINLHVRVDNTAAVSLYEKAGFVKKEIVENFYTDGEPAYLYSGNKTTLSEMMTGAN